MEAIMFDVDFDNPAPQLLCHPSQRHLEKELLEKLNPFFLRDHFILFSSGTTGGDLKGYAVSKKALFLNAEAVNNHFSMTSKDVWGLSLPVYHIGGLSVLARAHLLKNKVLDLRNWKPELWFKDVHSVSITTIVPTQLYDIVKMGLKAPSNLRYLFVGGDFLSSKLKEEALKLGWPVIRTFGMSELCSQIASTKSPQSDELEILPIHQTRIENDTLLIKSSSVFTLEFTIGKNLKVKTAKELSTKDGFFITKDRAKIKDNILTPLGRVSDDIKVSGHLVNINLLKDAISSVLYQEDLIGKVELAIEEDDRKGKKITLLTLPGIMTSSLENKLMRAIHPAKLDEVREVESFKRTDLGKLKKH